MNGRSAATALPRARQQSFCDDLLTVATVVVDPPPTPGAVPRDPDDDMIVACAVAVSVEYIVSRDDHLLSLGNHGGIRIVAPEGFIHIVRQSLRS